MVHRYLTLLIAVLLIGWSIANVYLLGSEFLPTIDEGNLLVRATMPASISLSRAVEISAQIEKKFKEFPEVETCRHRLSVQLQQIDPTFRFL